MPICTLHLITFNTPTNAQSFVHQLQKSTTGKVILASKPRHIVIHPTVLDNNPLTKEPWDLLLLLLPAPGNQNEDPIPSTIRKAIKSEYKITTGIPSKLLKTYPTRNKDLQTSSTTATLTGSLEKVLTNESKSNSQNLELSPTLLSFMNELSKSHPGPVTMLNLLHFQHPGGKQSYYQYGQAFIPVAGKRGGDAKLVGNVVPPPTPPASPSSESQSAGGDSRGDRVGGEEWWNEISLVHYPSIRHFCDMLAGDDYQAINEKYRLSALRDTFLLCTTELDLEGVGTSRL